MRREKKKTMPRVYIGRLSYHVRDKDVERFFGGYGKLLEVDIKNGWVLTALPCKVSQL